MRKTRFFWITCIFLAGMIEAQEVGIPRIETSYRYAYNLTTGHRNQLSLRGSFSFNKYIFLESGVSTSFHGLPESFYFKTGIENAPRFLRYEMTFLQRDFPDLEIVESTIYPSLVILGGRILELELGVSMRILNSDRESLSFHPIYSLRFNILNRPVYRLSLSIANFDRFQAGNISHIRYNVFNSFALTPRFDLNLSTGFYDSGQLAFTSFFSEFFAEIGVRYSP